MFGVFGWASLSDANYRCVVGKSGRLVGTGSIDWNGIGGYGGRWYSALSASFYGDMYGFS